MCTSVFGDLNTKNNLYQNRNLPLKLILSCYSSRQMHCVMWWLFINSVGVMLMWIMYSWSTHLEISVDGYSVLILGLLPRISEKEEAQKLPSMFQVRYRKHIIYSWGIIILQISYNSMNKLECHFWHWLIAVLKTSNKLCALRAKFFY